MSYQDARRLVFSEVISQHEGNLRRLAAMPPTDTSRAWIEANETSLAAVRVAMDRTEAPAHVLGCICETCEALAQEAGA